MRIAILSDIHGNLMALDAVMTDIEGQDVDDIWCGGDIGWGGPWPNECIARVREAAWTTVRGNTDIWITGDPQGFNDEKQREETKALADAHEIGDDDASWLINLPLGHSGSGSILLVHGTPESPFVGPMPDAPSAEFVPYEGQANVVVYGHVHHAFVRCLADRTVVCNTGSVGLPLDGPTASYLIVDHEGTDWTLRHRRVPFDRRAVLAETKRMNEGLRNWFLERFGP